MLVLLWSISICPLLCFVLDPLRVGVVDDSGMYLFSSLDMLSFVLVVSCVAFLTSPELIFECLDVLRPF